MPIVGPGVKAVADAKGDVLISDEEYHVNADATEWSRTVGRKGLYMADNVEGSWVVTFWPSVVA